MTLSNRIPYGYEALPGRFRCADCGYELAFAAGKPLPPCPLYDDGHSKSCWMPLAETRPAVGRKTEERGPEADPPALRRKAEAIDLAMVIINDALTEGASIQVESLPLSRNRARIRQQLESLSSGAFVLAIFPDGSTEYFDIMYKCHRDIAIMEYSDGLGRIVEEGLGKLGRDARAGRQEILSPVNTGQFTVGQHA